MRAARRGVAQDDQPVHPQALPSRLRREAVQEEGRHVLAAHARLLEFLEAGAKRPVVELGVELFFFGERVRDDEPRASEAERGRAWITRAASSSSSTAQSSGLPESVR